MQGVEVTEHRFSTERAITLRAGELSATFLPGLGMTGVSLRYRGGQYFALPRAVSTLRAGKTLGLPLLAPWANRLATREYRAAGTDVDLTGLPLRTDSNGLPMHGLLIGSPNWRVDGHGTDRGSATLQASIDVDAPAFPFPHRIDLSFTARDDRLDVDTTVTATGRGAVPVAFGWHPYLRLPDGPRNRWRLRLPARRHLALDAFGIPTGASADEAAEADPVGRRTYDDLYALGSGRHLALVGPNGRSIELQCGEHYPYAQVWVPPRRSFAALEPMTVPTSALCAGTAPHIGPGESFSASYSLVVN